MNYFHLDNDPVKSVQYLHDVHLRKMCTETAQIVSTSLWITDCSYAESEVSQGRLYLPSHEHHPIVKWAASSNQNIMYLAWYHVCMCEEYFIRFGKRHASQDKLIDVGYCVEPDSTPPLCMPNAYKRDDTVESYRLYYICEKQHDKNGKFIANYTKRDRPYWL